MHNHCKARLCVDLNRECKDCHFFDPHQNKIDAKNKRMRDAAPLMYEALEWFLEYEEEHFKEMGHTDGGSKDCPLCKLIKKATAALAAVKVE
jgi:hypothetical protein